MIIFTLLALSTCKLILPLADIDKQYLFNLSVEGTPLLFRIDFQGKESSIKLPTHTKKGISERLKVGARRHQLGEMVFQDYKKTEADMDVGGVIGLGPQSSFIKMIEEKEGKTVSLTFQLNKSEVQISNLPCESIHFSPFLVQMGTWSSFPIQTPLSFNFNPPEDFLALLNTTKQPFILSKARYNSLMLDVELFGERRQILVKNMINCWKIQGSNNEECQVKLGKDVGRLLFDYPIMLTKKGLCLKGGDKGKVDYDARFAGMIFFNILTIIIFLNWQEIRNKMREQKVYIPTGISEYSIEKISLVQDMVSA